MIIRNKIWSFIKLCLPALAILLFLIGCLFAYITFEAFADNGLDAKTSLLSLMASIFLFIAIALYRYFPFPKIIIFSFKCKENETVPVLQYSVLFIFAYFIFSIIFNIVYDWLGRGTEPTFKAVLPSAFVVAYLFILKYDRVMTKIERRQIILGNILISFVIGVGLYALGAFDEALTKVSARTFIGIMVLVIAVTYWLQHITYGWFSRILLKNMEKNKNIRENI